MNRNKSKTKADAAKAAALDAELAAIAKRVLSIPTLEARNSDSLDFHEVSVWSVQEALREAYHLHRDES